MSEINFPIKDLSRRKQQTTLTIIGLTVATAATIFLVLFGSNLGFEIGFITQGGKLTSGFYNIFSQFILIVSILNVVTGLIITSFLVQLTMSTRIRDIGVMKASGCLSRPVFAYFFTELSLMVLVSTTAGIIIGISLYYCSTIFLSIAGFSISQNLDITAILVVSLVTIVFSHIFGALPIKKASKAKPIEAMSPIYEEETNATVGHKVPSKLGFTFKMAYRNLLRRQSTTIHAIICFTAVLTLITVTITGGLIANNTTSTYVERAIGRNVVLVGHPKITERYVNLLSQFFEYTPNEQFNYNDSSFAISGQLVSDLGTIQGVTIVDPRLVLETSVRESLGVVLDPVEKTEAILIGSNRTDTALVVGVQPENIINDWLFFGEKLGVNETNVAMIGDTLAVNMFEDATNQRIKIFDYSESPYDIVGVCVDTLNNGKVVYMPLETMHKDTGQSGYNLVFVQIDSSNNPQVFDQIEKMVNDENLNAIELNLVLDKHINFLNSIWSLIMFLPLFTLVTAVVALFSYITLSISGQQHEFGIMRAVGAKQKTIIKIIFCQVTLIILVSGMLGIFAGSSITFELLIPDPVISQSTISSAYTLLIAIVGLLCVFSLYPAVKAANKTIIDAIS
ncbi:MAG: FtsX-like permease family protein [Candidatus Bathyarchaeota archaeon]|nr:FtsX-like permease family protein [Candidatus Bathyarchaeum sp.]